MARSSDADAAGLTWYGVGATFVANSSGVPQPAPEGLVPKRAVHSARLIFCVLLILWPNSSLPRSRLSLRTLRARGRSRRRHHRAEHP